MKNTFYSLVTNASDVSQSASDVVGQKAETIFVTSTFGQKLALPPNVGFEVGKVKTLLYLQVHFKPMKIKTEQEIGVDIHYTEKELPLKAGIYSLHAAGMYLKISVSIKIRKKCTKNILILQRLESNSKVH